MVAHLQSAISYFANNRVEQFQHPAEAGIPVITAHARNCQ